MASSSQRDFDPGPVTVLGPNGYEVVKGRTPQRGFSSAQKILILFGTRPEIIKLAPVIHQLEKTNRVETINVNSSQHTDLLQPFVTSFGVRVDHNLQVMQPDQTPSQVCSRVLHLLDSVILEHKPALILVQGDTTTALAGALSGFYHRIPVAHVEAGLRSGNMMSPFPEEMNRRLITRLTTYHFAATAGNRETLLAEGVADRNIFVTGNPVVDALKSLLSNLVVPSNIRKLLKETDGLKRIVLTTHRRESFGTRMSANLRVLCDFVLSHHDVAVFFPVHPNPAVAKTAAQICGALDRVHLLQPLSYGEFIYLLSQSWLIVSDSGGVQEEAPTLGKPLLILRENTERPEAIKSGVARLVGRDPVRFASMLEQAYCEGSWSEKVKKTPNPFGCGDASQRIAKVLAEVLSSTRINAVLG